MTHAFMAHGFHNNEVHQIKGIKIPHALTAQSNSSALVSLSCGDQRPLVAKKYYFLQLLQAYICEKKNTE